MTLKETVQLLAMIYARYHNAPKTTKEDAKFRAMAWCSALKEYSLKDVWDAAETAMRHSPDFVPNCGHVLTHCRKSIDMPIEDQENIAWYEYEVRVLKNSDCEESQARAEELRNIVERFYRLHDEYDARERAKLADEGEMLSLTGEEL